MLCSKETPVPAEATWQKEDTAARAPPRAAAADSPDSAENLGHVSTGQPRGWSGFPSAPRCGVTLNLTPFAPSSCLIIL